MSNTTSPTPKGRNHQKWPKRPKIHLKPAKIRPQKPTRSLWKKCSVQLEREIIPFRELCYFCAFFWQWLLALEWAPLCSSLLGGHHYSRSHNVVAHQQFQQPWKVQIHFLFHFVIIFDCRSIFQIHKLIFLFLRFDIFLIFPETKNPTKSAVPLQSGPTTTPQKAEAKKTSKAEKRKQQAPPPTATEVVCCLVRGREGSTRISFVMFFHFWGWRLEIDIPQPFSTCH